jgi:hypothetical protein
MLIFSAAKWLACGITGRLSLDDARTLREVDMWAWTTVRLDQWDHASVAHGKAYPKICSVIVLTSLFEVVDISYQASQGAASHYNTSDALHRFMLALMGLAALGLTALCAGTGLYVMAWGALSGAGLGP